MDLGHAIASRHETASAAHLAIVPPSRRPGLHRAFVRVGRNVQSHLASLSIVIELMEAYAAATTARATDGRQNLLPEPLGRLLHEMTERARETGDPLPYKAGLADVSDVIHRAARLAAPILARNAIEIRMDMLAPLVVTGDAKLLIQATMDLMALLVGEAIDGSTLLCTTTLRGDKVTICMTANGRRDATRSLQSQIDPFGDGRRNDGANPTDLGAWCARLIIERHAGKVSINAVGGLVRIDVSLPGRLL